MSEFDPNASGDGNAGGDGGAGGGAGGGGAGGDTAAAKLWYDGLSGDAPDAKTLSDLDFLKVKGFDKAESVEPLLKSYRALESKLAADNRIEVPGEGASDEAVAAYRKAIGVPESVEGYGFDAPEGWEAEMSLLEPLRAAAHKANMPKAAWDAQVETYKAAIMDRYNAINTDLDADRDALFKEWGGQKDANVALMQRGFQAFGLDADAVQAMQVGLQGAGKSGARTLLEMGLKLGQLSGEDGFVHGGAAKSFGIPVAEARSELARLEGDRTFIADLRAKKPEAVARHERLLTIIAQADDAEARRAAG